MSRRGFSVWLDIFRELFVMPDLSAIMENIRGMHMNRALHCLVMILTAAGSMFAAASVEKEPEAASEPTVIRFAHSWSYGFSDMLEQFQRGFSNEFRIEEETSVGLQHKEKILIDVSSDDLPDVFTFWSYETNLGYFKKHKLIIDIQEYFDASSERNREDFYPSAMEATEINGINYAIPHEQIFGFFVINSEIFESLRLKTPKTWEDIKEITPILLENGITPLSMGSFKGDPGHLFFSALTYQTEGGLEDTINLKKSRNFIYPGTVNATRAVLDLIKYNAVPSNSIYAGSWDHQINEYNERKASMIFSFNWNLALF